MSRPEKVLNPIYADRHLPQDPFAGSQRSLASALERYKQKHTQKETPMEYTLPNRYVTTWIRWTPKLAEQFADLRLTPDVTELKPVMFLDSQSQHAFRASFALEIVPLKHREPFSPHISWFDRILIDLDQRFGAVVFDRSGSPSTPKAFEHEIEFVPAELQFAPDGSLLPVDQCHKCKIVIDVEYLGTKEEAQKRQQTHTAPVQRPQIPNTGRAHA